GGTSTTTTPTRFSTRSAISSTPAPPTRMSAIFRFFCLHDIFPLMLSRDQVLAMMRDRVHHPAGMRELLQVLRIPRDERTTFKRHVKTLVASGDLIQIRGHRFGVPEKMDLYVGRLQTHPAGYGFVTPERALEKGGDIYISGLN